MAKIQNKKKQRGMFGQLLRNIREFQNISKEELSRGVCSEKALEKYESGEREPDVLTAAALFSRLKKSLEKFNTISDHTEYEQTKWRIEIWRWLCSGDLAQAEKGIEEYAKINDALHYQYTCLFRAELLRKRQIPIREQIANVVDGIYQTLKTKGNPGIRKTTGQEKNGNVLQPDMLSRGRYSKMELLLLERYAILLEKNREVERAVLWYKAIVKYLEDEEYDLADKYILYPIMAYKLAGYYEAQRLYGTAVEWIRRGCKMLRKSKKQFTLF